MSRFSGSKIYPFPKSEPLVIYSPVCVIGVRRKALVRCGGRLLVCPGTRHNGFGRLLRGRMSPSRALAAGRAFPGIDLTFRGSGRKRAFFPHLTAGNFVEIVILCYFSREMANEPLPTKAAGPGGNAQEWGATRLGKYRTAFFDV